MTRQAEATNRDVPFPAEVEVRGIEDSIETFNSSAIEPNEIVDAVVPEQSLLAIEQQYRSSTYSLLAALLRASPDQDLLDILSELVSDNDDREDDSLLLSMTALSLSAKMISAHSIEDEYHQLFIGLGKGEVVPYGSWYLTGFLMEKPLSDLRDDLTILGYERSDDICEPEDHAAALCEVFSFLISDGNNIDQQYQFYKAHMAPWIGRFFDDLSDAKSAVFYKSVGRFGGAFIAFESEYFSMQT
ncbi:MAG: TorA maturation chaperone TorD [Polaribacter sp.]|jgi:TorA maturation chaperone TorD